MAVCIATRYDVSGAGAPPDMLKGLAMDAALPPPDPIADSERIITTLQQHQKHTQSIADALELHQTLHHDLLRQRRALEQTIQQWRSALSQRWQCEVDARRVYLRAQHALEAHFGAEAAELQLFLRGNESDSNPPELLADLRRLHSTLTIAASVPLAATRLVPDLLYASTALADAIIWVDHCDWQRRNALLNQQLSVLAFQRTFRQTQTLLAQDMQESLARKVRVPSMHE